jgi:hypothetical protein
MTEFAMSWRECATAKEEHNRARTWLLSAANGDNPDVNAVVLLFVLGLFVWGCILAAWMWS